MTRSRLGRRLALLCLACALLPVLVFASWQVREAARDGREHQALQLAGRSQALAESLTARLAAADALAAVLSEPARGDDIARLRAEAARSGVFTRVLVGETELAAVPRAAPAASAGGSALVSLATNGGASSIYVARAFGTGREPAYFEVSPAWLWQELARADAAALVVDADGTILWRAAQAEAGANAALVVQQAARSAGGDHSLPSALGWQSEQREWRGATAAVRMPPTLRLARDWSVATWAAAPMPTRALRAVLSAAAVVFLLALLLAGVASFWMTRRLLPSWLELEAAVARLGVGRFSPVDRERQPAELLPLADAVNAAGVRLDDEVRALETLAEIDRMLLGATELEPVLDAILRRATGVVRCDGVGIALLDTDSPVHGRVLVASASALSLPVARVEFDPEMIEHLLAAEEGITVARSEQQRHSFLLPMRELGCEFFWVWPVAAAGRLVAVLSMGFREAPASDPRIARRGSSFAERLAVALSKTAREEHLYRQAHFDPLTALPNRLLFRDRLEQELASAGDTRSRGALLYIDLDHFKRVNDGVGHAAGDQLLQIVAQRLRACVKEGDTVARLGGDEFTVILRNVQEPESAAVVAERIIDSVRVPVSLGGRDHHVQASIGIALFPDDGANLDELLRNADLAMYRAKELGRHRAVFFDRKLMMSRFDTTHSGLYRALRRREFSLYYQPQFSLGDGRLVGVEALLRWQTPRDGTRTPQEFIPAAEASGLIVDIGGWVLEAACAQFAAWRAEGIAPARISVNVSVQQLKAADFPRTVRRVLDKHGIPAGLVEIELTESVFADDVAGQAMRQLAELGVRLALDDFGTGYSSLNYLRQHPIHVIKIDRSFLDEVPLNESSATLASTIITMAHALGKEVVAEGVERVEQLDFLRERGCDLAQGFYLAQPLPAAQLLDLLRSQPAAGDLRGPASEGPLREVG